MWKTIRRCARTAMAGVCSVLAPAVVFAQGAEAVVRSESPSGVTVTAEVFCSETKLRTANVRVRWSLAGAALAAFKTHTADAAKQTLDTTVYAQGFEKGLYVTLPVPSTPVQQAVAPLPPSTAAAKQLRELPRAFQIRLIESTPARAAAAGDSGEFQAVVEDLEPGVNYTWRLNIETPSGRIASTPVTVQAPTCPADMVQPRPPTKKPPPKRPGA